MATKSAKAARLPGGRYAYRGRAVPFSKLPKREQSRFRSAWAGKAAKTRERKREPADHKKAREWVKRRTAWVPKHGKEKQYAAMVEPGQILDSFSPKAILEARALQKEAHRAWMRQGKHGGGRAWEFAKRIRDALGPELSAMMPQMWWYH